MQNMNQIMKQMQNMQKEMMKSQEELEGKIFEVTAGGGMIKLEMKHQNWRNSGGIRHCINLYTNISMEIKQKRAFM